MTNIVQFPKAHKIHPPQSEAELKAHAEQIRIGFVSKHSTDFAFDVFRQIELHGFNLGSDGEVDKNLRFDMVLINEAIKSCLLRSMGEKHPLQEFAENIINLKDSDIDFLDEFEDNTIE
jgi:hypothetical protein|tara:strand:+ start:4258 stop:4614 length:357 start_codon:yes stop_codon:yes gene_type:complete